MVNRNELEAKLKPIQQKAALMLVESQLSDNPDVKGLTLEQIAEELGVSRMTIWRWRQEPVFIEYMNILSRDFLSGYQTEVFSIFLDSLRKHKSAKFIELYMKAQGLLKDPGVQVNVNQAPTEDDIRREVADIERLLEEDDKEV